jgi:dihydrofolate reductase
MGRIRFDTAVTLNGFLADEHHSLSWLFAVPGSDEAERDIPTPDAAVDVMGSHTYEWMLRELDMLEHPEKWGEFFGSTPVYVFTTRLLPTPAGADIRFIDGSVAAALAGIREAAGDAGDTRAAIVVGYGAPPERLADEALRELLAAVADAAPRDAAREDTARQDTTRPDPAPRGTTSADPA